MTDGSGHEAKEKRPDRVEREVILRYIDQNYQTLSKVWSARSWVVLATMVLSLVLLGTATGVLTTKGSFALSGLDLSVSLPGILVIGNILLTVLVVSWFGLTTRTFIFRKEIEKYYKSLGFSSRRMSHPATSPFRAPSAYDLLAGLVLPGGWKELRGLKDLLYLEKKLSAIPLGLYTILIVIALSLFPAVLPAAVELLAVLRLASIVGWERVWVWVPLLSTVVLTLLAQPTNMWIRNRIINHIAEIPK